MRVLLIEDNPIFQIKLRNLLDSLSFKVKIVASLRETAECLKIEIFDLLICDIVLSDGKFFDIDEVPVIPTIFITAYENSTYMDKALQINNSIFLVKPFSDLSFIAAVKHVTADKVVKIDHPKSKSITVFGKYRNPIILQVSEIEAIASEGNYSAIYLASNEKHILKRSARLIIQSIDSVDFVRVQRSTYIHKCKVTRVSFSENKIFTVNCKFGVSKNFKANIYEFHALNS